MLRSIIVIAILSCISQSASAQAYFSTTPVDNGSYTIPEYFSGTWKEEKYNDAGRTFTIVLNPNKTGHLSITNGMGGITPAIISKTNDNLFLNIYDIGGPEQPTGFYIFKLEITDQAHVKLIPIKYDLQLNGNTLQEALVGKKESEYLLSEHTIWLTNNYATLKKPLETKGRKINVRKKE